MKRSARLAACGTPLTPRELEVLRLICAGNSTKEIAQDLGLSERTMEHHRLSIRSKLLPNIERYSNESLGMVAERMGLLEGVAVIGH